MSLTKSRIVVISFAVSGLLGALALPVSNFFLPRKQIADATGDPQFARVSKIMQASCADCHSPNLTSYPLYSGLPLAKGLIDKDISEAQSAFALSADELSGKEKISTADLARIASAVQNGSMPPFKYAAMHWGTSLSPVRKEAILAYVQTREEDEGAAIAPLPKNNPFHVDKSLAALGEKLFFEKRLSADNSKSCASCHALDRGGADAKSNSPTVFNSAFNFKQFADGHAANLVEQAREHIKSSNIMDGNFQSIIKKLDRDPTYGARPKSAPLSENQIVEALAAYEKTLITPDCAFDLYLQGDQNALDAQQKQGYQLFMEKNCASCHGGVAMGGTSMAKISDRKIKVPLLRNIAMTGPYFHDGSAKTLSQAVDVMAQKMAGSKLTTAENEALVAFLHTLTGKYQGQKLH